MFPVVVEVAVVDLETVLMSQLTVSGNPKLLIPQSTS